MSNRKFIDYTPTKWDNITLAIFNYNLQMKNILFALETWQQYLCILIGWSCIKNKLQNFLL